MLLSSFADVSDNPSGLRSSRPNVISPKVLSPEILDCSAQNFIMLKKIQQIQSERFIQNLGYGLVSWRLFGLASRMKISRVVVHAYCRPVAEQANAGQAGPLAVLAHVGQVWVFGGGSIHLSFHRQSFFFEGVSPVLFKL